MTDIYIVPPDGATTAYAVARQKLHITKAKEKRIQFLCTRIGMAPDAAKRQVDAEWDDGSSAWVAEAISTLPSLSL